MIPTVRPSTAACGAMAAAAIRLAAPAATPGPLNAQLLRAARVGASARGRPAETPRLHFAPAADSAVRSTLSQRFAVGLAIGGAAGALAGQLAGREASHAAYVVGSAAGVMLAAHAREGARSLPVLLGTAVGSLPLLAVYGASEREDMFTAIAASLLGAVTTPLLGAIAHDWGGR